MRSKMILLTILCLLGFALPLEAQEAVVPRFEPTDCPVAFPPQYDVECGYLVVPEEHRNPENGATIKVKLAVFKTQSANPLPDPVVFLSGGPGSNTLDSFSSGLSVDIQSLYQNRDIIFIDQRGMGYSQPALQCPEVDALLSYEQTSAAGTEAAKQCYDRLVSEGVNIGAFNTVESAGDVAAIAPTLGYEQYNIYGGSYGSTLAFTVMRNFPQGLRSAALTAITPPQVDLMADFYANNLHGLNQVYEACAADEGCSAAFPNLPAMVDAVITQLNAESATVTVKSPVTGETVEVRFDGNMIAAGIPTILYGYELVPQFPALMGALFTGQYDILQTFAVDALRPNTSNADGAFYAMRCMDDVMTSDRAAWEAGIAEGNPLFEKPLRENLAFWFDICDYGWGAKQLDPVENTPLVSEIPTLMMSVMYDPATPSKWGELALETLSNGYHVVFPTPGHSTVPDSCQAIILSDFMTDPTTEPETSCVADMRGLEFVLPS